jgi:outer membrane protein assembly factor BamB
MRERRQSNQQDHEKAMKRPLVSLAVLLACCAVLQAENWPAWRGPTGQGFCAEKNVLLKWSNKGKVKWKVPLENQGNSTPVVWGDRIFLTQANKGGTVRSLLCFARADGKLLWQKDVKYNQKERNWNDSWYCNASPVTDGKRVVISHGSAGMYCYDFEGKELWKRTDLGSWTHAFGNASSPILYGELAILWCGPNEGKAYNVLLAVNKETGKTVWDHKETFGSWSTPLIVKVGTEDQLILGQARDAKDAPDSRTGFLKGFDPKTGKEIWRCQGLNSFVYTSPLVANGVAVQMCGFNGSAIAVKLGGEGDITKERLWKHPRNIQRVGSGMIVGNHVYIVDEDGSPRCYDLKTGDEVWKAKRTGSVTWGSMVHAEGRLYVLMRDGTTRVFAAKPKYEVLAVNSLGPGEQTNSSLVISNGDIFIRTFKHLWCIGEKGKQGNTSRSQRTFSVGAAR